MTSYKDQFNLVKTSDKTDGFYDNKYSFLNTPTTYNVEPVTPENMHPFNQFETLKNNKNAKYFGNRRDNTVIIKDWYTNETGQYAKRKQEIPYMFEPMVNTNALAGDTKIVDKIGLNRFSDTLKYRNGDLLENTRVRPESIDGVPITFTVRPREKTQEELRGKGINSQRLASEGRNNMTGSIGEGVSTDPETITITKYKMKSYRDQNSVDDLLKTTGVITRPEWRSLVKEPATDRSYFKNIDGPAMAAVMRNEFRNQQEARPTIRTDYEEKTHILNPASYVSNTEYRNEQMAKPTLRQEYEDVAHILNPKGLVENMTYRNEQMAKPTVRQDYEDKTYILNPRGLVDNTTYRNEQMAKPTVRQDYEDKTYILNPRGLVDNTTYRNEQMSNPTIRQEYEDKTFILNPRGLVDNMTYRNEQLANPTIRMEYENNKHILNPRGLVDNTTYRNEQLANPTLRMEYEDKTHILNTKGHVNRPTYHNEQEAHPTLREDFNNYDGVGFSHSGGHVYENQQTAHPTLREANNNYDGVGFNQTAGYMRPYDDLTRSGVVEEVLAKDYMGVEFSYVPRNESHISANNMVLNESIEDSINLTNRELMGGGVDRIPQGKNNIGKYTDWNRREKDGTAEGMGRVRNVGVNFITEVPATRGYNLLEQRSNINEYVPSSLSMNPFVNNINYVARSGNDVVREYTELSDRLLDRM